MLAYHALCMVDDKKNIYSAFLRALIRVSEKRKYYHAAAVKQRSELFDDSILLQTDNVEQ